MIKTQLDRFRFRLADFDALPQLTFVGIIIGLFAGSLIVVFRLMIDIPLIFLLPGHNENFEGLSRILHFGLPVIGALILGLAISNIDKKFRDVSVGNVLERFHNFQGRMPLGNLIVQFFGGVVCLISGQSVGREGPAVHIGASAASLLGQWLRLPNNSLRTLVGCGVAAAISSSFNTPVAGVIFAMEVVLMSYSIIGFIPIMMASVCGALVTRLVFGEEAVFTITNFQLHGLIELPLMVVAGFIIALFATLYMRLQLSFNRFNHHPIIWRLLAAGVVTGTIALAVPEVLGLGYDTVNLAIEGKLAVGTLLIIVLAKVVATSFSISMGMPGGLIGPQLFIGAGVGAMLGTVANMLFPGNVSDSGFYVLLGMAAMMGAVINAPLAALMTVLELTYSPAVIFPSMLIIVVSCITTRQLFKCEGIFMEQLAMKGKSLASGPAQQILNNIGVRSAMKTSFVESNASIPINTAKNLLSSSPLWIVINQEGKERILLRAANLAAYIAELNDENAEQTITQDNQKDNIIDLLEIPGERLNLTSIHELATLYEAQKIISDNNQADAIFVTPQIQTSKKQSVLGIITSNTIDNYYKV